MRRFLEFLFLSSVVIISSCNRDEVITTALPPEIILDGAGIYSVKQGDEIRLAPRYERADDATFEWVIENNIVCTERAYVFYGESLGDYFITLTVTTAAGSASEELKVEVVEPEIPTVSINGDKELTLAVGSERLFEATLRETSLDTSVEWLCNGKSVSNTLTYNFVAESIGRYEVVVKASNADGEADDSIVIDVLNEEDMPFIYTFPKSEYHSVVGRKLRVMPDAISDSEGVTYTWSVDGVEQEGITTPYFVFRGESAGTHTIAVTAEALRGSSKVTLSHNFAITIYDEAAFYRTADASSLAEASCVVEYRPAPGQFIGDTKTGGFDGTELTKERAAEYALQRLNDGKFVSLGAFGGYIVVGFDHSIACSNDYDFEVIGNSFDGSSEPGVVWVMQDENGNGMADDTWYELRGSETGAATTIQEYAVTYYRPSGKGMPVAWSDSEGKSGTIEYLESFHNQDSYYPAWITESSYTLRGTRLEARNYDSSGNGSMWILPAYGWGYADNFSEEDLLEGTAQKRANAFRISNAIDFEGESVKLSHIDFVKVQCAIQATSGWIGEVSTEVLGIRDHNL